MRTVRSLTPLLGLVLLTLAACAPAATGTSPSAPYPIGSSAIFGTAGSSLYVEASFTAADFKLDTTKLKGALWVPSGYNAESAVITTKFSLDHVRVPAGWSMKLVQVQATRTTVEGAKSFSKSSVEYTLTALLAITPKAAAVPGPYHLDADLTYQKESKPLKVRLRLQ